MQSEIPYYIHTGRASDFEDKKERVRYRLYEILPGFLSWLTIGGIFLFSFFSPVIATLFIIIFDTYWLVKTIYLSLHLRVSFFRMRGNMKVDWLKRLREIKPSDYALGGLESWQDIYHLILFPAYKEPVEIIEQSLQGLADSNYPLDKMIIVLAQEARAGEEHNRQTSSYLQRKFGKMFFRFITVEHPDGLDREVAGKGSNITWAGRHAKENVIDQLGIPYQNILVSAFDVDTVIYKEYFGRLSYKFLTTPDPLRASYQPVAFFVNNIWETPAFARVVSFSSTFWQTIQQERSEQLITFSSHSMPFQALVDIGFWQKNMVSEDSRVFWQCLLRYDGDYRVVPLYYPVAMDANVAPTFWRTMVNVYKQHRRWAWGVENVPYFLFGFYKNKKIPWRKKIHYTFKIGEGYWSWATNAVILFALSWLPILVGGPLFQHTVLAFNLPFLARRIMMLAMVGLITSAVLSMMILPPRPPKYGKFKYFWMAVQWALLPATTIIFGALPALEAQTRLMLGKYMGFWVTPKYRSEYGKPHAAISVGTPEQVKTPTRV